MAYTSQYPYSAPSRDAMYADPRAVAPSQGGIHINVTYPQHRAGPMYQYDPAAHGPSGPHASYGPAGPRGSQLPSFDDRAAMSADVSAPHGYTALASEPQRGHAVDAVHGGYAAAYGPPYMSGATSQFSDSNIDPRLRRPDSSLRSSYRLSEVTDEEWRSSSPDGIADMGQMGGYGRLPMTTGASRATTESTLTPVSDISSAPWSEPEPTLPTSTPVPAMAPPAIPERALEEASSADEAAPTIVPAPNGATVRRRSRRKSSAGKNASSSTLPAGSSAESGPSTGKGRRGKKRALEDDVPASAAKRRKDAQPEPEPEAGTSTSSTEAATSSTEATTSPTPAGVASPGEMKCRWAGCGESVLAAAHNLGKHLKDCHVKRKEGQDIYPCMWDGCKEEMKFGSVVRHVTTRHLTFGASSCTVCGATLSRLDSGDRHLLEACCRCRDCKKKFATPDELKDHGKLSCPGRPKGLSRKGRGKKATKVRKQ